MARIHWQHLYTQAHLPCDMRWNPTFPKALVVTVLLLLAGPWSNLASGTPTPLNSTPDHHAGYWNTTFDDPSSNTLDLTIFYPARTAGEGTIKDLSGAPYPTMVMVHHAGYRPAFDLWWSYGEHFSERGFVVGLLDMEPYDGSSPSDYDAMVNATLAAVDHVNDLGGTSGSQVYGTVNSSAMVLVGHGTGAAVGLRAMGVDDQDRLHGLVGIGLRQTDQGTVPIDWGTDDMDAPMLFLEGSADSDRHSNDAFEQKARGYVSYLDIWGANFTQFMDVNVTSSTSLPADINRTEQHRLAKKYILAYMDFHFKEDALAAAKLYGNQAAADKEDGTLAVWRYGVLDQSVELVAPLEGASLPTGPMDICATVTNLGPFPMSIRNVTLEVARVLPGPVYQTVFGPTNRSVTAQQAGSSTTVEWTPVLTVYGEYAAFARMDDPDHNATNDRFVRTFSVVPLMQPTIEHEPPDHLELGLPYNLSCRLDAPSGIVEAFVNFSDVDGFRRDIPLTEDPVSGHHYVVIPAPTTSGQVAYKIHAKAGNGATNSTNPFYIAVVDTTPPTVEHTQVWTSLPVMAEVELEVTVTDAGGVDRVHLLYTDPFSGFRNVTCGRDGNRWFYPVVTGPERGSLVYSWYAIDSWGNEVRTGVYTIDLVDDEPPEIEAVPTDPVELGDDLTLEACVTDGSVVAAVWVTYSRPGEGGETNGTPDVLGDVYRITITNITRSGSLTYGWWARDANGLTSTTGQLEVAVQDTVPPQISEVATGDAVVGLEPWIQAQVVDGGGLASVTLDYTDVAGGEGSIEMEEELPGIYEARLPLQAMGGAITYRILVEDRSGNLADTGDRTLVVRDLEPPVISHTPPQDLVEGQAMTFEVEVTDNVGVTEVWL